MTPSWIQELEAMAEKARGLVEQKSRGEYSLELWSDYAQCTLAPMAAAIGKSVELLKAQTKVCEAAASVASEDRAREELLSYVQGAALIDAIAALKAEMEKK